MTTAAVPSPYLNGASVAPAEVLREADFLQKILQIRDAVLASKHPRIHLPAKVIEQVAPRLPQTTISRPTTNGMPNGAPASSQLFPPRPVSSLQNPSSPVPPTQRPYSAKSSSSSIDPILLTKSPHLVKAEQQLRRQQIERQLKDQFDKKGRGNDAEEREVHINVEECLIKAHLLVPPVSGLRSPTNNSDGVESFDENSYYSSKADSWSSEEVDTNRNNNTKAAAPLISQVQPTARQVTVHSRPAEPTVIDLDEEAYEPADDIEIYEPESALLHGDAEEEDYSPPPADIGPSEPLRGRARDRHGGTNGSSRRQSPAGPAGPLQNPRKRRREEKRDEKKRQQQQTNKRVVRSPEPYIKEEPQSPPPFSAYPDSQPSKRRALQPIQHEVEVLSAPEGARMQPVYYRDQESAARPFREFDEPSSPTVIRVPHRKSQREDQDLRRVASLQYARRPYSPSGGAEMYAAPEPRQVRAASHAFADRSEPPIYREASARLSAAPRYVRERSRSPIHEYISRPQSPMMMAPPPRRIVVDQYGNKYYAAPVDARESMAPPIRRMEVDPYYERAVTREPTMRAPARNELYEEEAVQMMPPPPRRYVEASEPEMLESPAYRPREVSRRPLDMEYRPVQQYEEMGPPREYAPSRAYSMRPEVVRREVPEGYVRHESIQPTAVRVSQPRYREVSVVRQEPFDERRYISAPQSRRYVEEGPVEVAPEQYAGEPRRVYNRY
ncbi:hypothetical protein EJ02DRAFT_454467 [Clathrospora elynae]|uniref:Uncharacterized protein n=1 Tax=Clathrospora elynae TaxID=706981 RepID=A0A6A5SR65_9PLEO|nr:hypothetical protein EJ02DRAFT_454467 [Clathrospora elynae]